MPDDLRDTKPEKIRCDACPVMCYIADGKSGACDRYANHAGELVRLDPLTVIQSGAKAVAFLDQGENAQDWDGDVIQGGRDFVTAVGAGTTYPDYKPAPFIVSQEVEGVDMVTVVTEGIFSYCGVKVKIDTDRHIGDERAVVRVDGEAIGHVMTSEYGSKMLSLGGVEHLTGGSKKEGRVTCDALLRICNREAVEMTDRRRRDHGGAGGQGADHQRCAGKADARRVWVGHHRDVRQAVARACGRGDRRR